MHTAKDLAILEHASAIGAVVVTLDADFHELLATHGWMRPSVVRLRVQGLGAEQLASLVQTVVVSCVEGLEAGAAVTAHERQARVRLLPLP